jgi:hypothetical protein
MRYLSIIAVLFAILGLSVGAVLAADPQTHEGTVVSAGSGKLVMKDAAGKEHSHNIDATAKVTVRGKTAKLDDLKPNDRIRVMTSADNKVTEVSTVETK